mgnify:CR=1 FL=1
MSDDNKNNDLINSGNNDDYDNRLDRLSEIVEGLSKGKQTKSDIIFDAAKTFAQALGIQYVKRDEVAGKYDYYVPTESRMKKMTEDPLTFARYANDIAKNFGEQRERLDLRVRTEILGEDGNKILVDTPERPRTCGLIPDMLKTISNRKEFFDTVKLSATEVTIDKNLLEIGNGVYWDKKRRKMLEKQDVNIRNCYKSLFDTPPVNGYGKKNSGDIAIDKKEIHYSNSKEWEDYWATAIYAKLQGGRLECPDDKFKFIWEWMCNDDDLVFDYLKYVSINFLEDMPLGMFFKQGPRRNGKSSANIFEATYYGSNNTGRVDFPGFSNWSHNNTLYDIMRNIPDESVIPNIGFRADSVEDMKNVALAKTISDHGTFDAPVKGSSQPMSITADFTSKGCTKQSLPV